jgi:phospholipase/carboxylesterase
VANLELVELAGLTARVVAPADPKVTCVLLHGFGAAGDDLVSLAGAFSGPDALAVRFVFPAAPLELPGLYGDSRAWWMLDLAQFDADMRRGVPRDRRSEIPKGLPEVRAQVTQFLAELSARFAIAPDRLVLGGFSQGAMLSLDVALHREVAPAGLVLMSGTLIAQEVWAPRMASLAGVPIALSHGRSDGILPFAIAELLRDQLIAAGAVVDWQPFNGGHEIPMPVITAAGRLLARLTTTAA